MVVLYNRGVVATLVSVPALAGPLFSGSLVLFPDCISTYVLLNTHAYTTYQLLAIWRIPLLAVVLLLSLALRVGLLRRLPPPIPRMHMHKLSFICSGPTTFEMPTPPLFLIYWSFTHSNLDDWQVGNCQACWLVVYVMWSEGKVVRAMCVLCWCSDSDPG